MKAVTRQYMMASIMAFALVALQFAALADYYITPWADRNGKFVHQFVPLLWADKLATVSLGGSIAVILLVHLAVLFCSTAAYRLAARHFAVSWRDRLPPLFLYLLAVIVAAVLWNRLLYPYSAVFPDSDLLLRQSASPFLLWMTTLAGLGVGIAALWSIVAVRPIVSAMAATIILLFTSWPPNAITRSTAAAQSPERPNVIIIGIDSLRPDFLPVNGFPRGDLTPTINEFVASSVRFGDAITPMARTFVSYMSILSGQYPTRHGARFNLYPRSGVHRESLMSTRFRRAGYFTSLAIDESRFANFDDSFGFDVVEMPHPGAFDFLIGSLYDTVFTNLLSATPAGRILSPQTFANRGANRIYHPSDYSDRLNALVGGLPNDKPIFFVAHFCLPHWPYSRGDLFHSDAEELTIKSEDFSATPVAYARALRDVDRQVADLLDSLREAGRLNNAIVVLLSDHGEGLGLSKDSLTSEDDPKRLPSYVSHGHGGFVLADTQQHVLLSMRQYGTERAPWLARRVEGATTLIDLAPTLLEASHIEFEPGAFDGMSLLPFLISDKADLPQRMRFVESGLSGATVDTGKIDERAVAAEFASLYRVTPDLRFEIAPDQIHALLQLKQRGAFWKDIAVATNPRGSRPNDQDCWVLADYELRTIGCLDDAANDPVAAGLVTAVCEHFKQDDGFTSRWCAATPLEDHRAAASGAPVK